MADEFVATPRTPLTMVSGSRGPENIITERVKIDMADEILTYVPRATPLLTLTGRLRNKRTAKNYRYEWIESDEQPRELELTAASAAADTSLDVTAGDEARVAAPYILLNTRTREQVLVTSTSSGVVNVTRNIDGNGAVDMVAGDILVFTRPVHEDGADIAAARSTKDIPKYNYTEIIRTPMDFTRRGMKTDLYGGKDPVTERKKIGNEHKKSIEYAMYFGQRNALTGTHIRSMTGGLDFWIKSNIWDVTGVQTVSQRAFDEMLEEGLKWGDGGYINGSGVKYFLCSSAWVTEINWWAKDLLEYRPLDETIGFGAMEYKSPFGKVMLVPAPILDYNHKDRAYLLDLNHIRYVKFQDDDTHLLKDRGQPGVDGVKEEWLSDVGIQVELEASHVLFKGLGY